MNVFEQRDITIKYYNGEMKISLQDFFPASNTRLNKLLNVVELDYRRRDEHYENLIAYCKYKVEELTEKREDAGKKSLYYHQMVANTFARIESGKHPNGVRLTKEELDEVKEAHKHFKAVEASYVSDFKRCAKQKERFLKHIEILEQRK